MSSPDTQPTQPSKDAKLVNPPKDQVKMVKIRAKQPLRVMRDGAEVIIQPGTEAEVTKEEAKEFCDKSIDIGIKDQFGQFDGQTIQSKNIVRAERVREARQQD